MKLIARVVLCPTSAQQADLLAVLERVNAACACISAVAWETKTFHKYNLQKLVYTEVRDSFHLSANLTIRAISKVADAYKLGRTQQRIFKRHGAIPYDYQIVSYRLKDSTVSLQILGGRIRLPFTCGEHARTLLATQQGESDLLYQGGKFFLYAPCTVEEPPTRAVTSFLGVDAGITNIAVTSEGTIYGGGHLRNVRYRHRRLRQRLQRKGTKSAKRRLRALSGKERRFATNTNHVISTCIVTSAKGTAQGIALEDLKSIRSRVTVRRGSQRVTLHSWSFSQLRQFITYKARLAGIPVVVVNPRNTSRTCPACGCIAKANRQTQASFLCMVCGFAGLADLIAATIIGRRAALNQPNAGGTGQCVNPLPANSAL